MAFGKANNKRNGIAGSIASAGSQTSTASTPTQTSFHAAPAVVPVTPATVKQSTNQNPTPSISGAPNQPSNGAIARNLGAWGRPGGGASMARTAAIRYAARSMAPSRLGQSVMSPSDVASDLAGLTIDASTPVANPSEGPRATELGERQRAPAATTRCNSVMSASQAIKSIYAKVGRYKRRDFKKGVIISVPFHTANTNPHVDSNDPRLAETVEGYVYSKRRMLVVLYCHTQDMTCLPLWSFQGKGIQGKPEHLRHEHVSVRNDGDKNFVNQGVYEPVAAKADHDPFTPMSAIHITGGVRVGCNEDIAFCGKLTRSGYTQLVKLYKDLCKKAEGKLWRD